jgi:glyoxylase-like metal-dependent hydrolase (beta-lactamase superfamily II)
MKMRKMILLLTLTLTLTSVASLAEQYEDVQINSAHVSESVYMLTGAGGNIGVSAGDDGILIIDDQFAPLAEKIAAALTEIAKTPTRYVINTHYHGDHTGSNAYFHDQQDSTIFAHDKVRERLASEQKHNHSSLPVVTYAQGINFHFNGETIKVEHLPGGHTDSDSVVWFENADVLHAGDLFFQGRFPYIDLQGGGTVEGYIKNVTRLMTMLSDDSQIIPGHGKLATKADYQLFLDMLTDTAQFVAHKKQQGQSLETLLEMGLDAKWQDWAWEFIDQDKWITTLYQGQ